MPATATTRVQFFSENRSIRNDFRAGVSLHSHTMYSEESLEIIPAWIATGLSFGRVFGKPNPVLNLRDAFWTPPLTPRQAHRLEETQIETQFQLPALVSLTDHDDIRAGSLLRVLDRFRHAPISTEWTIPFPPTFFHVGVHNLPAAQAHAITAQLAAFTCNPEPGQLGAVLAMLNSYPDVLLVLNHPLWDEKGTGESVHNQALHDLLSRYGRYFHALELNGLRSSRENNLLLTLAQEANLPVVAGGDRHGLEPNAVLNLTRSNTLVEFIHEVRYRRFSQVMLMPQYEQHRRLRILQTVIDVLQDYPENFDSRRTWGDRVFCRHPTTRVPVPFATVCADGSPQIIKHFLSAVRLLDRRPPSVVPSAA